MHKDANIRSDKQDFYRYMNDASNVKDLEHVQEFANVREYFDYDPNYPDKKRICKEVEALQNSTDFPTWTGLKDSLLEVGKRTSWLLTPRLG